MGFDIVHFNLHKTFTQPHGGGGPGAGPIAVSDRIEPYLPRPQVVRARADNGDGPASTSTTTGPKSIGRLRGFQGNFGVFVRSYAYICSLGGEGLRDVVRDRGAERQLPAGAAARSRASPSTCRSRSTALCMHEFVLSGARDEGEARASRRSTSPSGCSTTACHPPTVYFPLLVDEALMIEPTETETQGDARRLRRRAARDPREAAEDPEIARNAPYTTPVRRLDEARRGEATRSCARPLLAAGDFDDRA